MDDTALQIVLSAVDKASDTLKRVGQNLEDLAKMNEESSDRMAAANQRSEDSVTSLSDTIKQFAQFQFAKQISDQFISIGKEGIQYALDYASQLQQTRITFDAFTGSVLKGGDAMKIVNDFAKQAPLIPLPEIDQGAGQLLGFGLVNSNLSDLKDKLKETSELAVAAHTPLSVAIDLFARAREGIFNLREMGQFGITRDELEKFGVSFTKAGAAVDKSALLPALEKLINTRFGKLFGEEANSWAGFVQNVKDDAGRLAAAFMGVDAATGQAAKGSLFEKLQKAAGDFYNWLDSHESQIGAFGEKIGAVIGTVIDDLKSMFDYLTSHKDVAIGALIAVAGILGGVFVGSILVAGAAFVTLVGASLPIIALFAGLGAVAAGLATAWATNFGEMRTNLEKEFSAIRGIFDGLKTALIVVWDFFVLGFSGLSQAAADFAGYIIGPFIPLLKKPLSDLSSFWNTTWSGMVKLVQNIMPGIGNAVKAGLNDAIGFIDNLIKGANSVGSKVPGYIKIPEIPKFASGTNWFGGGLALVGEQGPELVNLPRGSQVIPNSQVNNYSRNANVTLGPVYVSNEMDVDTMVRRLSMRMKFNSAI